MKACPHCQASYPTNYTHCPRDGTPLLESQAWREGTTIRGKYRILGKIGEGGMAVVYKAMHTRFEELRALKVMNPELAGDQAFVRRFMHEAVLTRKLQHGNAVRVEDIDEAEDGRPFIVMEYIEGRSLKEVIQAEAPMASARVCSIAAQVAGALDAAHRMGIIHRDIKPANIFLVNAAGRETAKVLDFGIAKAKEGSSEDGMLSHSTLTGAGSVIGTPAYMSPEQARGLRGDQLDGRSDLYSLGVVMYEMLINGLPLKADTSVQWILAHAQTPPRPLWEARPDLQIPPAIAALVMRCLAKNSLDRPESAYSLIEEIRQAEQQGWSPGRTLVFSQAAPESWASGVAPARASDVPRTFATTSEPARASAQLSSLPVQSRSSRSWAVWGMAAGLAVLIAAAVLFWSLKRPTATPAAATEAAPAAPGANSPPAMPSLPAIPASEITHAPDTAGADASTAATPPLVETTRDNTDSAVPSDGRESARQKKRAANQAEILAKSRQFAQALLQAKNAENDGRFEDALREYEWASTLEPSDTALKRHIKQLRDRIARENELIH
ncbi:MAG TPA: serine/threonine-protein kinase [Terriglobales bacterium]|nr:serine/threonine-protein kinase [Terriglobales bacterium]